MIDTKFADFFTGSLFAALLMLLTACGGGGSGGGGGGGTTTDPSTIGLGFNQARGLSGAVNAIALANDGSGDVYVGGDFISYNSVPVGRIARFNSDGTLDTGFDSSFGFDAPVYSIAVATDGAIYVGGGFNSYKGSLNGRLVRLHSDGSLDADFTGSEFNGFVLSIAIATDGKLYIGGSFTVHNGTPRQYIARMNTDGTLDATFDSNSGFNGAVNSIAVANNGGLYVGGVFTSYKTITRQYIARLNANGTLDNNFDSSSGFNRSVLSIAIAADGKLYVGGRFTSHGLSLRQRIARLNANGSLDTTFDSSSGFDSEVQSISLSNDGTLYVGGDFAGYNGKPRERIAHLNADGTLDSTFDSGSGFGDIVFRVAAGVDGKVYVGGRFRQYKNDGSKFLVRLHGTDASVDNGFSISNESGLNSDVYSIVPVTDGSADIYVGGYFEYYKNKSRRGIARLNSDGSLDTAFDPSSGFDERVTSIAITADSKIYVGGNFNNYNGVSRQGIARLHSDGSLDTAFDSSNGFNDSVESIVLSPDGKLYVGGWFTSYNGVPRQHIVRLNDNGSLDTSFDSSNGFNDDVLSLIIGSDGKLYAGGEFSTYNGVSRQGIARLHSNGSLDTAFDSSNGFNNKVVSIALAADGKLYAGGWFSSYNGVTRGGIARLHSDGRLDTAFDSSAGFNNRVGSIALAADGKLYAGGWFNSYNGVASEGAARLHSDGRLDITFDSSNGFFESSIESIAIANDGSGDVFFGGYFASYKTITVDHIVRLNPDASLN